MEHGSRGGPNRVARAVVQIGPERRPITKWRRPDRNLSEHVMAGEMTRVVVVGPQVCAEFVAAYASIREIVLVKGDVYPAAASARWGRTALSMCNRCERDHHSEDSTAEHNRQGNREECTRTLHC